ncbi:MAG: HAD-IA family hydrolase [Verrucomicrobiota bacterium]
MKIETIFFDLGRVLLHFDFDIALYRVRQQSSLSEDEMDALVKTLGADIDEYETGSIETEAFFRRLKDKFQYQGSWDELKGIWQEIFTPLDDHIQMARMLSQYYPTAIISNTSEAHIDYCEKRFDFFDVFKKRFYSYQMGVMKPKEEIYTRALKEMNADKFTALFIDDLEENIMTPSKMGWQTIHLRPDVDLRLALQSYELRGV